MAMSGEALDKANPQHVEAFKENASYIMLYLIKPQNQDFPWTKNKMKQW